MKRILFNFCQFKFIAAMWLCLWANVAQAQVTVSPVQHQSQCGSDIAYFLRGANGPATGGGGGGGVPPPGFTLPPAFLPSAISHCQKIDLYFADVNAHIHTGFDDTTVVGATTLGAIRRNTFCEVATYIQSVIDFSNVADSTHIRLFIDTSFSPVSYPADLAGIVGFAARAYPQYDSSFPGIKKGWMNDYITSPSWHLHDSIPSNLFHGVLQFNFDKIFDPDGLIGLVYDSSILYWQSDADIPFNPTTSCGLKDLYGVMLHESLHCMGWFSLIGFSGTGGTGLPPYAGIPTDPNIFTALDWALYTGANAYPLSLTKVLSGSPAMPVLDVTNPSFFCNNNYWINDSAAPDNYPVYSGGYPGGTSHSYLSHLDDQQLNYTIRERISPGDAQDYVMGPFTLDGVLHRKYSKAEIHTLINALGYTLTAPFIAANLNTCFNHRPYSRKTALYGITPQNYAIFTETVTPDDTLTNNVGVSRVETSIAAMIASGDLTDADPGDIGHVYIDTTTLVNFRGCGIGGNNHLLLHISPDSKTITYTPRPNFYGKAQYGYSVTDGKENGSFVVVTIEVFKGNNVTCPVGTNMICNPGFEEGSEVSLDTFAEGIKNSVMTENQNHEGKWQGICFSDSHPYCFLSDMFGYQLGVCSGTVVQDSHYGQVFETSLFSNCGVSDTSTSEVGNYWLSSPTPYYFAYSGTDSAWFPFDNPLSKDNVGKRYQQFSMPGGSYYYLADSAKHCHKYTLEFDLYKQDMTRDYILPFTFGFADHIVNLSTTVVDTTFNFSFRDTITTTYDSWVHYSFPFHYCGDLPSNVLFIATGSPTSQGNFLIDNLSLKEDTTANLPLLVSIIPTPLSGCLTRLKANVTDSFCNVSYTWSATAETVLTASADTITSNLPFTYTVTVSDGCRDTSGTYHMTATSPMPITGPSIACVGSTITLSDPTSGGNYTSSNPAIATVGSFSGLVTGLTVGVVNITYTAGCIAVKTITVSPAPVAISGSLSACIGNTTTLSDPSVGGTWSSSNASIATIGSATGILLGVASGNATITYTLPTGCYITAVVTVNTTPFPITGLSPVCIGASVFLTDVPGGGTWSSLNPAVATIGSASGMLTGISAGTTTISYVLATGCYITIIATVNSLPGPISGITPICVGSTETFTDVPTGGTWTSTNTAVATIGSGTGMVTGLSAGNTNIKYTLSTGCSAAFLLSVNTSPAVITGSTSVCVGATVTLSDATPGGTWSSSNVALATVGSTTGIVSGVAIGVVTITYSVTTGCTVTALVTVNPVPSAISGLPSVCVGSSTTLSDPTTGGTWSSSTISIAAVGSATGIVTGVSSGTATITYSLGSGCKTTFAITVNPSPAAISGSSSVCVGSTTTLSDPTTGGTWTSSTPSIAAIGSATGVVSGITTGVAMITYTLGTGCFATAIISVNALPASITGTLGLCTGTTTTLSDATGGGAWSSGTPAVATVGSGSGIVTGISSGTATITYTLATGCFATATVTVSLLTAITGTPSVCVGQTTLLSDPTTGGSWSSSAPSVASVASGVVTGVSAGTAIISYTLTSGCFTTITVTVHPLPSAITGTLSVCAGRTTTLSDPTTGGSWSCFPVSVATIGSGTGIVTGVSSGTVLIDYTLSSGCYVSAFVTVNASPAPISGSLNVCAGTTTLLSDLTPGGIWSSGTPLTATVSGTGMVTGVTVGTATITYALPTGCYTTVVVTVNSSPAAIFGGGTICPGLTLTLTDATTGGSWVSVNPAIATVGLATGIVTGVGGGTATIDYVVPSGCFVTATVTIGDSTNACSACNGLPEGFMPLSPGGAPIIIYSDIGPGSYYLGSDATISGTVNFNNANILIAPGVTITIAYNSSLAINGSHLFGTCQMWKGMVLQSNLTTQSARLSVTGNSMIEDAVTAVYINRPVTPDIGAYILKTDGAVFNRNITGVDIERYTPASTGSYPFLIRNTVVTSRDFKAALPGSYPYSWPSAASLKALWGPLPDVFTIPFNIANPAMAYNITSCKNGAYPYAAIVLDSIGSYTLNVGLTYVYGLQIPQTYSEIVIGDPTTTVGNKYQNLYDVQQFGIYSINSNVSVVNNAFTNMYPNSPLLVGGSPSGDGIYAAETNDNINKNRLQVYTPAGTRYHNIFYDFKNGVEATNYFHIKAQYNYMINKTTGASSPLVAPYGMFGYLIKTSKFDTLDIESDTMSNLAYGISIWETGDAVAWPYPLAQFCGQGWIFGNVIQASPLGYSSGMTQYVYLGISVQNALGMSTSMGPFSILGNTLTDVYNGIYENNMWQPNSFVDGNRVQLRPYTGLNAMPMQYGINNTLCQKGNVYQNTVTKTPGLLAGDSTKAYYAANNTGLTMHCNAEIGLGRGYEFFLTNLGMNWNNNNMDLNGKGMVLNAATIGAQGFSGGFGSGAMGNKWFDSWSGSNVQTYVYHGANAASSKFYVLDNPLTKPVVNSGDPTGSLLWYAPVTSIVTTAGGLGDCPVYTPNNMDSLYLQIAQQQVDYTINVVPSNWMGQFALWNAILNDSTLTDSSATIAVFASLAANSRYKYITDMETLLANGNIDSVTTMLGYNIDSMANTSWDTVTQVQMADNTGADNIVQNYQNFFGLYIKYAANTMTGSDSLAVMALAQLCPERNGTVVYQARGLYSELYNDLSIFNDDSCLDADSTYIAERHSNNSGKMTVATDNQRYSLFPNPNDGSFSVQQYILDVDPVQVKVYDAVGRKVFTDELSFANAKSQLNLNNYVSGMYLLEIKDSRNRVFRFKFVINR